MDNTVNKEEIIAGIYRRIDRIIQIKNERASLAHHDARLAEEERQLRIDNEEAEWRAQGQKWRRKVVDLNTYRQMHRWRVTHQPISHVA